MPSNCPICEKDSLTVIYPAARDYITGEIFQVRQCRNCTVTFTSPLSPDPSPYYPVKYRQYQPVILAILELFYKFRAQKWSGMFEKPGLAFEMGCGSGIMLNALRERGWKVFGSERTVGAAEFASRNLLLPVFVGEIESLILTPSVDLIILFQVLEHLNEPLKILKQLNQILRPGGRLVIAVPNFDSWQSRFGGVKWFHLDVPRHHFHFSLPALEFCLKRSGFEVENVGYVSLEHDPYGWIQTVLNRLYKQHNYMTRFLMGLDRADATTFVQVALALLIGILSLPVSLGSWLFGRGAIMEIVARKSSS